MAAFPLFYVQEEMPNWF